MKLYTPVPSNLDDLLRDVDNGRIGLPDLQRPFVWKDVTVRDLLDSMIKGYPVGHIMLWRYPAGYEAASRIGNSGRDYPMERLVIDGQQRLTSLLAALYGRSVKDENFNERGIRIAFNPLLREFQVWSQAYERAAEWISEVSQIFKAADAGNIPGLRKQYIRTVNEAHAKAKLPSLTDEEEERIEKNIQDVVNLKGYVLPSLEISAEASEEDVADIFVRVNSGGKKLTEKNFIDTLLAVYDPETHDLIEKFCEESRKPASGTSYNYILDVDPAHLIRVAVALAFSRARLRYAYMMLRGKDLESGRVSDETRAANLKAFRAEIDRVIDINNWHAFLNLFADAGYVVKNLVASENAVVFSYALYLTGKYRYGVGVVALKRVITKWIFMATITGFYTGSTETEVERMYADLRAVKDGQGFVDYLDALIASRMSDDFFNIQLTKAFSNSAANAPEWFGFVASLNVLNAPMWFGNTALSKYLLPGANGTKKALDRHHIFPKEYLTRIGITDDRLRNQAANFVYIEASLNIDISDDAPRVYARKLRDALGPEAFRASCEANAIPENFDELGFDEFVEERKKLMVRKVRDAFGRL